MRRCTPSGSPASSRTLWSTLKPECFQERILATSSSVILPSATHRRRLREVNAWHLNLDGEKGSPFGDGQLDPGPVLATPPVKLPGGVLQIPGDELGCSPYGPVFIRRCRRHMGGEAPIALRFAPDKIPEGDSSGDVHHRRDAGIMKLVGPNRVDNQQQEEEEEWSQGLHD